MKLKTQEEIIALSESKYPIPPMSNTHEIDLIHHKRIGYQEAYSQAQQDLSEQASEGFEEWEKREHPGRQYGHDWQNNEEGAWQAAQLSMLKTHISKKDHEIIVNQALSLHGKTSNGIAEAAPETYLKLKKQIESLKSDLDWATQICNQTLRHMPSLSSQEHMNQLGCMDRVEEIRQRHCLDKREEV